MTAASIAILPVALFTVCRARRLYAAYTARVARMLLWFWGVRVHVHGSFPPPARQVVYVSNHSSTLDLFVLTALGLPNTRFFLSGFLQKFVPLAILARLMGTFFTVPQSRTDERRRIFRRACHVLERSRESVYLSPEGGRITSGEIGPFNKGAFHLATALAAPIVPLYFVIPVAIDPGVGYRVRPGDVHVFIKPTIETSGWQLEEVAANAARVRAAFAGWHREAAPMRYASHSSLDHRHAAPVNV
ncbi:MAG TPA: lysophospholipid acyltransferase family protein [Vicinamibacterales bacterium]|nr:lysophospholipid acyltransferase family protein [Vicinamibacterales bacterium]